MTAGREPRLKGAGCRAFAAAGARCRPRRQAGVDCTYRSLSPPDGAQPRITLTVLPDRFQPLRAAVAGTSPPSVPAATAQRKERFVNDEETQDRPRRRGVLLAMLVAAALLLALAGSGAVAGSGGSAPSSDETPSGAPPAAGQSGGGQGFTHHGRHCHHDNNQ